jgi:hypothetical protein
MKSVKLPVFAVSILAVILAYPHSVAVAAEPRIDAGSPLSENTDAAVAPDGGVRASAGANDAGTASDAGDAGVAADAGQAGEMDLLYDLILRTKGKADKEGGVEIAGFPIIGYQPVTSLLIGVGGNLVWRWGPRDTTSLSDLVAGVTFTLNKQILVSIKSVIFSPDNKANMIGDWRFNVNNQQTWGLGPLRNTDDADRIDFYQARFYQSAYYRATGHWFFGGGVSVDYFWNIVDHNAQDGKPSDMQNYYGGRNVTEMLAVGLTAGIMYDSRDNPINPKKGLFAQAALKLFPAAFGGDSTWESFWGEFRAYPRLGGENILAIWTWAWFSFGGVPYLDIPAIGWDMFGRSGRGFVAGRIRSKDLLYAEVEYRIKLMKNDLVGMVLFVNGTAASVPGTDEFNSVNPAGGTGLRVKLNKKSETNLTLDFAFGERYSYGLYLNVQETF